MYKEVILKEFVGTLEKGARGEVITKHNGLYFIDFGKYGNPTSYLWVKPSKVETINKKSNYIGE